MYSVSNWRAFYCGGKEAYFMQKKKCTWVLDEKDTDELLSDHYMLLLLCTDQTWDDAMYAPIYYCNRHSSHVSQGKACWVAELELLLLLPPFLVRQLTSSHFLSLLLFRLLPDLNEFRWDRDKKRRYTAIAILLWSFVSSKNVQCSLIGCLTSV